MVSILRKLAPAQKEVLLQEARPERLATGLFSASFLKKASLGLYAILLTIFLSCYAIHLDALSHSAGKVVSVALNRGPYELLYFPSQKPETRAIILFGSGDGGWSSFEETISLTLQGQGYEVIGINSNAYARTDYNLDILQDDFRRIAEQARAPFGQRPPPVIIGGWSMGAEQAVAAGGGPHAIPGLVGLLLLDPGSRGRYGLRLADEVNVEPTGPGTYSMTEFDHGMGRLHIVQWHAEDDTFDSALWLRNLAAPHRKLDFANTGHYYTTDRDKFLHLLVDSIPWLLSSDRNTAITAGGK
jgi:phosphatidylglycerol lysyltransferase